MDLRLAWSPLKDLELAIVGRNLLHDSHAEFAGATITREVPRSVYGTLRWSF
jgi:iron complex outermembrane receptor protein